MKVNSRATRITLDLTWCFVRLLPVLTSVRTGNCTGLLSAICVLYGELDSSGPVDCFKEYAAYATNDLSKVFFFPFLFFHEEIYLVVWVHWRWPPPKVFSLAGWHLHSCSNPACLHSTRQTAVSTSTYAFVGPNSYLYSVQAKMRAQIEERKYGTSSNVMSDDSWRSLLLCCVFLDPDECWKCRSKNEKTQCFNYFSLLHFAK